MRRIGFVLVSLMIMLALGGALTLHAAGDEAAAQEPGIMLVVYFNGPPTTYALTIPYGQGDVAEEIGDMLYVNGHVVVNDLSKAGWGLYHRKEIYPRYEADMDVEIPWLMSELALEPVAAADLPHSQHIAKVKSINPALTKPVMVTRKWMGQTYDIACLASESIVALYQAGKVQVGDYVIVSFIDEIPETEEISIPVVVDKVYRSW